MSADALSRLSAVSVTNRAAKSNGSRTFLGKVDGRLVKPRRLRDIELSLARDIGTDLRYIATGERALITQASTLILRTEEMQTAAACGEPIKNNELVRVTNALRRVLADLKRRHPSKPAAPSLSEYLATKSAAAGEGR